MKGKYLGEIPEILKLRSTDICKAQGTRYRGKSDRMIKGKVVQFILFWMGDYKCLGGVGIFLTEKWIGKIINVTRVSDRMTVMTVLRCYYFSVSVYLPHCGLDDSKRDHFYDNLTSGTYFLLKRFLAKKITRTSMKSGFCSQKQGSGNDSGVI